MHIDIFPYFVYRVSTRELVFRLTDQIYVMRLTKLSEPVSEGWKQNLAALGLTTAGLVGYGYSQAHKPTPKPVLKHQQKRVSQSMVTKNPRVAALTLGDYLEYISGYEGNRNTVYKDTKGIPTIGIGFNLTRADAARRLNEVGSDLEQVLAGGRLSDAQIKDLAIGDIKRFGREVVSRFPDFGVYPDAVQLLLVDMMFNLGPDKFDDFKRFQSAILAKDWGRAADELVNTPYHRQTKRRASDHISALRAL